MELLANFQLEQSSCLQLFLLFELDMVLLISDPKIVVQFAVRQLSCFIFKMAKVISLGNFVFQCIKLIKYVRDPFGDLRDYINVRFISQCLTIPHFKEKSSTSFLWKSEF